MPCFSFLKRKWNYWKSRCLNGNYKNTESRSQWELDFECEMQQQDTLFSQYSEIGKYITLSKIQKNVNVSVLAFCMLWQKEDTFLKIQQFFLNFRSLLLLLLFFFFFCKTNYFHKVYHSVVGKFFRPKN